MNDVDLGSESPTACPCHGRFYDDTRANIGRHFMWVAFLHYENEEYRKEEWGRDYSVLPTNYLTCVLSGSTIFHCQIFFWDNALQTFTTISVDAYQKRVFVDYQKQFRHGWTFLEIEVTQVEEMAMYNFLTEQVRLRRPFNTVGAYALFIRPISTDGESWFCSQLDVAALQEAGYLIGVPPHTTSPADLYRLMKRQLVCDEVPTPIRYKNTHNALLKHNDS